MGAIVGGRFGVLRAIGSPTGSSGVYEAFDLVDDTACVVKLRRDGDDAGAASLAREVWFLAGLGPRVGVRLRGHGISHDAIAFFARDAATGTSLEALSPMSPGRAARALEIVCDAVGMLHEVGVVHADLTLAHAFVDELLGRAAVIDLGAAVLEGQPFVEGTPAYRAPEASAGGLASPRTDVFALGRMLHRALAGPRASFAEPLPASTPPRLRSAVEAACDPDPEARPKHASELAAALREV